VYFVLRRFQDRGYLISIPLQCYVITLTGVVTLSFSGRKGQGLVDIQAKQAAIFHASKASRGVVTLTGLQLPA